MSYHGSKLTMELPFLSVNYDTLTKDDYTTLKQGYDYKQCYHPTEREIKKKNVLFDLPLYCGEISLRLTGTAPMWKRELSPWKSEFQGVERFCVIFLAYFLRCQDADEDAWSLVGPPRR
jgi:hypothetical protein